MKTRTPLAIASLGAVLAFVSVPSQAAVEENASVDVEILGVVPCAAGGAGEIVDLSGREHFLITGTMTATTFSGHFMIQPQGMSGIGETILQRKLVDPGAVVIFWSEVQIHGILVGIASPARRCSNQVAHGINFVLGAEGVLEIGHRSGTGRFSGEVTWEGIGPRT